MPTKWPDIDPQIVRLLIDGGEELARFMWRELSGKSDDDKDKKAVDAIRRKGQEALVKAMQDELEQQAAVANLALQLAKLGPAQRRVLEAFDKIDNPTVPVLGLNIEEHLAGCILGVNGVEDLCVIDCPVRQKKTGEIPTEMIPEPGATIP